MDDSYGANFIAIRLDLISNLKRCWAGAGGGDDGTVKKLADSIADVLLELSPDTNADAATAIYADAKSIAEDVIYSSTRRSKTDEFRSVTETRA